MTASVREILTAPAILVIETTHEQHPAAGVPDSQQCPAEQGPTVCGEC